LPLVGRVKGPISHFSVCCARKADAQKSNAASQTFARTLMRSVYAVES
jgi:hypothetical protein